MNAARRQVAVDLWTKPTGLRHKPAIRLLVELHSPSPLLLLSPKADTHFTLPRRVEGWDDLCGWLHTKTLEPLNSWDLVVNGGERYDPQLIKHRRLKAMSGLCVKTGVSSLLRRCSLWHHWHSA